ncbi:MAG TPA: DUF4198 domain-containing protein [Candidatus Aerophobetes bacterium]|uniref:DUF4198 domain-containing protein n=1 Tax=Aerophobetes bacterium TaxID=2030807 RepID=A0A7V0MZ22_UNCAE|nr:DUF4198 domain-containing protein [Candidatus Aerophobetes bacterium]
MKKTFIILCSLTVLLSTSIVYAHDLWLNVSNYFPKPGEVVTIELGWGHRFPTDEVIKEGWLESIYAISPKGEKISLKKLDPTHFSFRPQIAGIYLVAAQIKPGFLTKTTEGYKLQTKRGLKNVITCFRYDKRAKAIIQGGKKKEGISQKAGHPLELIPLKAPAQLKEGDTFPLKVIFRGEPLSKTYLFATYAGFSEEKNTFAYTTMTDEEGVGSIKILKKGKWMVKVEHKIPFPDKEECDEYLYGATLTFEVR